MREHKYRVWSKELQKMVYFTLGQLLHSYNDEGDYPSIDGTDLFSIHQDINPDEAMQFTGLKDKNGKDIFCSDILRIESSSTGTVFEGRGGYIIEFADGRRLSFEDVASEHIEVVGNTWENKGLIEVNQ